MTCAGRTIFKTYTAQLPLFRRICSGCITWLSDESRSSSRFFYDKKYKKKFSLNCFCAQSNEIYCFYFFIKLHEGFPNFCRSLRPPGKRQVCQHFLFLPFLENVKETRKTSSMPTFFVVAFCDPDPQTQNPDPKNWPVGNPNHVLS
jgi:hypothetical protein